ncbi:MAG: hypothetical protein WCY26_11570 [Thiohalobacteraceae bacterium]
MRFDIQVTDERKVYTATCWVEGGMLTVRSLDGLGEKPATTSVNNEVLAKILLHELINESKGHGWNNKGG